MEKKELLLWLKEEHDKAQDLVKLELAKPMTKRDMMEIMRLRGMAEAFNKAFNKVSNTMV